MALQIPNFAGIEPIGKPALRDLVENLMTGYQAGQMPAQMKQQRETQDLVNAFQKMKNEAYPEQEAREKAFKEAQLEDLKIKSQKNAFIQSLLGDTKSPNNIGIEGDELKKILLRQYLGLPSETPEEKSAREMQEFGTKERMKADLSENPTVRTRTMNQGIIQAIDNTLPLIDELKKFKEPNQLYGKYANPNMQASYDAQVATITDALVSALNLPKTNESIHLVSKIVQRRPLESHKAYLKRLDDLGNDLERRKSKSEAFLRGEKTSTAPSENKKRLKFNPQSGEFE